MIDLSSPKFVGLSVFEKFDAVTLAIQTMEARGLTDPKQVVQLGELKSVQMACRAKATLLSPYWDMSHNLWLADKNRNEVLFHPYPGQRLLIDAIESARADRTPVHPHGRPIRLYMPKTRRIGGSHGFAAYGYREWRNFNNTGLLVMAHDKPTTHEIYGKYRKFWEKDPFRPEEEKANTGELVGKYTGSKIVVRTAGVANASVAHGFGFTLLHVSECARLRTPNPHDLIQGVLATLPSPGEAWTCALLESTGDGASGWFPEDCMALYAVEQGDSPADHLKYAKLLFLPAYLRHDARLAFPTPQERDAFAKNLTDEELAILDKYRPKDTSEAEFLEFLNWRRYVYATEIKGSSEKERRRKLREQHPITIHDSFIAAGGDVFDNEGLNLVLKRCKQPGLVGSLAAEGPLMDGSQFAAVTPKPRAIFDGSGPLSAWERPRFGHQYSIGVDVAGGSEAGDWTVAMVFDRSARRFVARYRAKMAGPQLVHQIRLLSRWYKDAIINPETNYDPSLVANLADTDRRQFLYLRKNPLGVDALDQTLMRYGWVTSERTKMILINVLRQRLEIEPGIFTDELLVHEMLTFIERYNPQTRRSKYGARHGYHDDVLIAAALALVVDEEMPLPKVEPPPDLWKPRTVADDYKAYVSSFNEDASHGDFSDLEPPWMN